MERLPFSAWGLLVLVGAGLSLALPAPDSQYTTKYDDVNLDEILNNSRLYKKYFNCLTGEDKCTPDGKELKEILPDALATDCSKCNERQKTGAEKVIKFIYKNKPDDFETLEKIFDPEKKYWNKYKETLGE